eukprot:g6315.t1
MGKKKKKKLKRKKKRKKYHNHSFTDIEIEEVVHTRKKEVPLYDRYKNLFQPGEISFWDRFLIHTPPVSVTNGKHQELLVQVDTLAFVPPDDVLDMDFKRAFKSIQHKAEERAEKYGWGKVRKKMIKDKKNEKAAKLPKIVSAAKLENAEFQPKGKKKKKISYFGDESDESDTEIIVENPATKVKHFEEKHTHEIILCEECELRQCTLTCVLCEQNYCERCLLRLHSKSKKLVNHFWHPYNRIKSLGVNKDNESNYWMQSLRS